MHRLFYGGCMALLCLTACNPKMANGLRKNDLKKDVEMVTSKGTMVIRLSDRTPLHRENFLKMVKTHYYDSILFHRVIKDFMIQAGDPDSKRAVPGQALGEGEPDYNIPAEIDSTLFNHRGIIGAARESDDVNPKRESSASQFYIVQGKVFTDAGLDSTERFRLKRPIPAYQREVYKTIGGAPHLDGAYTIFGEVIKGLSVIDSIGNTPRDRADRPLQDIRILRVRLIKRK